LRALIGPHAGFVYSGQTAAWAYVNVDPKNYNRVILLGPSHKVYLPNQCALSQCDEYATPLGNIEIDTDQIDKLLDDGKKGFTFMTKAVDENEHSLEMHLPFI